MLVYRLTEVLLRKEGPWVKCGGVTLRCVPSCPGRLVGPHTYPFPIKNFSYNFFKGSIESTYSAGCL